MKFFSECKQNLGLIKRNLGSIITFEILYRFISFFIIFPILSFSLRKTMSLSGLSYLSNDNLHFYLTRPSTIFIALFAAIILFFVVIFKISATISCIHASYNNDNFTVMQMIKSGINGLCKSVNKNFLLIFLFSILFTSTGFDFIDSLGAPEFITDFIANNLSLFVILVLLASAIFFATVRFSFNYISFCLEPITFRESCKESLRLTKKHFWGVILRSVAPAIVLSLIGLVLKYTLSFASIVLIKSCAEESLKHLYALKAVTFADTLSTVISAFSIPVSMAFLCTYYYKIKSDNGEEIPSYTPKNVKTHKTLNTVFLTTIVVLSLVVMAAVVIDDSNPFLSGANHSPEITAHRGSSIDYPENTMVAFEKAIEEKADWIELDVHQTSDNVVVITHDSNIKRIAGIDKEVWQMTYEELSQYDVGSWFSPEYSHLRVLTLDEVLMVCADKIKLNIEIKPTGNEVDFEKNVIDIVRQNNFENDCMLASLNLTTLKKVKEIDPEIKTLYDMTVAIGEITDMDFVDGFSIETSFVDNSIIDRVHSSGKVIFAWTVNSEENLIKLSDYDIDNILTDRPLFAREVLNSNKLNMTTNSFVNLFFKKEDRTLENKTLELGA